MTEEHIIISENRFITVPKALQKIAVQNDHNVETITFDCPRYWDGLDMSQMRIYINYMCADKSLGMYLAQNVTIDVEDSNVMHFDWTISRNATKVKGPLSFLICIKKTDEFGYSVNHWNSELNQEMHISEGLECEESVIEAYPDIISYLLTRQDFIEGKSEEFVRRHIDAYFQENPFGVDDTLTLTGLAADAKVVGDNIARIDERIDTNEEDHRELLGRFETHAHRHTTGSDDPITPAMINAVDKGGDTMTGDLVILKDGARTVLTTDHQASYIQSYYENDWEHRRSLVLRNVDGAPGLMNAVRLTHVDDDGNLLEHDILHTGAKDYAANMVLDGYPVGDLRQSIQADLGDKWLPCDGRSIGSADYPELYAMLPVRTAPISAGMSIGNINSESDTLIAIEEHDGVYVGISKHGYVCVSSNPSVQSSWTTISLGEFDWELILVDVIYVDDRWAVLTYDNSTGANGYTYYVFTATDPLGLWDFNEAFTNTSLMFRDLAYYNGQWAVAGVHFRSDYNDGVIYTTTDLSQTWTEKVVFTGSRANNNRLHVTSASTACHNGQWVVVYDYDFGYSSYSNYGMRIYSATNPGGNWTTVYDRKYKESSGGAHIFGDDDCSTMSTIRYVNNQWVLISVILTGLYDVPGNSIYVTSAANISNVTLDNCTLLSGVALPKYNAVLTFGNNTWYLSSREAGNFYSSPNLTSGWTKLNDGVLIHGHTMTDDGYVACVSTGNGELTIITDTARVIPLIERSNSDNDYAPYTFIKAKP